MKPILYASRSSERLEREISHCDLARRICADGMVLLENNGVLLRLLRSHYTEQVPGILLLAEQVPERIIRDITLLLKKA